ncbi:MAG: ABC transporter ATP-binding protein [Clostridia bacterium]|nr:ABC transporter ATP-binding protein [Clostridia bacterium]
MSNISARPDVKLEKGARIRVIKRMCSYLFRYKWMVLLAFVLMITSNLLALVAPRLSGLAIDAIEPGKGAVVFEEVFFYCGLMLIFYALAALLSYALSVLMINLSQRIIYTMRRQVFEHLTRLPVSYFDRTATGEIISHISYDIDTINASLSHDLLQICASVITVVGSFVMMLTISPVLILVFVITVPISVLFTKYKTKKIRPLFKLRSAKLGELNGYAEEMLSGQKTIKAYDREDVIIGRFDRRNTDAVDAYYNADYQGSMIGPTVNFVNNLSLALISMFGSILYMIGSFSVGALVFPALSLGDISNFIQYSRRFSGPINEMANIFSELQSALAAAERVFRLLDEAPEPLDADNAIPLTNVRGHVKLEHVKFGYTEERTILHDFTLDAKPGKIIAIVGPTGAGKTTIINLLMRFYDPQAGAILIDGNEIRSLTRDSLRLGFTMVLQDTWLFHGTIFENIAYGRENATMEEVVAAAKAARIHSYIEQLPEGYNTVLSDDGVNISKGQRQLITIARAMLPDAGMLILDEATSNVDSRTEVQIQEAMYRLMENKTCFVIAHRLSTVQNADTILVVRDGRIVEQGNHQELMAARGAYYGLYNAQFD